MLKKLLVLLISIVLLISFVGCDFSSDKDKDDDKGNVIDEAYDDKHELYAFYKTYEDYKEVAVDEIESKQDSFDETVKLLSGDFGIELPAAPLRAMSNLEKSGDSWEGTSSVWDYEITKDGDVYNFRFDHTMVEEITEGTCNPKEGTLFITVTGEFSVTKFQLKRLSKGEYLRFWSEKSDIIEETREHHTYFKGKNIAMGQHETLEPTDLTNTQYKDESYVELLEHWVKLINGKTSDSVKGDN